MWVVVVEWGGISAGWGISAGGGIKCKLILKVKLRIFAGICLWREPTKEETIIECGKFEGGKIIHGELKEIGLPDEKPVIPTLKGKIVKVEIGGVKYEATIN